jgi:hypothetical protein
MYFIGLRHGEIVVLGRTELSMDAAALGAVLSATFFLAGTGRLAIKAGFASAELPDIATAEIDAATVLSQVFRTTEPSLTSFAPASLQAIEICF